MQTIMIYSGGLDSTILLYHLINEGHQVKCISFNYGQKHSKELESAKYFTTKSDIEHKIVDLSNLKDLLTNSCLTSNQEVPEGNYAEDSMKKTVVPNRNMIMLSIATGWAINEGFEFVAFGAHSGDHTIYPDCRPDFVNKLSSATFIADWKPVSIIAPFVYLTKGEIVKLSRYYGIEYEKTWSCYKGRDLHCGKCGACNERIGAFSFANVKDNTIYE